MKQKDNTRILLLITSMLVLFVIIWFTSFVRKQGVYSGRPTGEGVERQTFRIPVSSPFLNREEEKNDLPTTVPQPEHTPTSLIESTMIPNKHLIAGRSFYVATNGSDTNAGTLASPFRTLQQAANVVAPGDRVYVRGGTYQQESRWRTSGTESKPILVSNYQDEKVIIDGNNTIPSRTGGNYLLMVDGNWVIISGLEVTRSNDSGVGSRGKNVTLSHLDVHHNWSSGILMFGDNDIAEYNRAWANSLMNENMQSGESGGWSSGISAARYPNGAIMRHNIAWDNWGEGISTFETLNILFEDNISFNNQENFYISDTKYTIFRRNLSYCTPGNRIAGYRGQSGILVGDEKGVPMPLGAGNPRYPSSDLTIVNNLVMGCYRNIGIGPEAMTNTIIANNTFVNATGYNVLFYAGTVNGVAKFYNNLILQEDSNAIVAAPSYRVDFSHNLWSRAVPSSASGAGDVIANPQLAKSGTFAANQLSGNWFKLLSNSPAINKAIALSQVPNDYFGTARDTSPDIGGLQFP